MSPPLRYFGGKWRLSRRIIAHFPAHRVYVEPFGGGASVLLRKSRVPVEVYNDLNGRVVNLFRHLRDNSKELRRLVELTPYAAAARYAAAKADTWVKLDPVGLLRRLIDAKAIA